MARGDKTRERWADPEFRDRAVAATRKAAAAYWTTERRFEKAEATRRNNLARAQRKRELAAAAPEASQ